VMISQTLSGLAWGSFEIALFVLVLDSTFRATRPHVVAAQSILTGLGQLVGSLLGGLFLYETGRWFRALFVVSLAARLAVVASLPGMRQGRGDRPAIGARSLLLRVIGLSQHGVETSLDVEAEGTGAHARGGSASKLGAAMSKRSTRSP